MNLIDIKDLWVSYKSGYKSIWALKNVNLKINSDEYVCIVGNNGAGKSSLIKSILGLVPISKGQICLNCKKDDISYVPQICTVMMDFPATVQELVLSGTQRSNHKFPFYSKADKLAAREAIDKVNLNDFVKSRIFELSGGQQQRVLLARAICKKPKVLILDEPCASLDQTSVGNFYKILNQLNSESHTTILMVSHDIFNIQKYASRIVHIEQKILLDEPANIYFKKRNVGKLL